MFVKENPDRKKKKKNIISILEAEPNLTDAYKKTADLYSAQRHI